MNHISTPSHPQSLSPVTPISTNLNQPHLSPHGHLHRAPSSPLLQLGYPHLRQRRQAIPPRSVIPLVPERQPSSANRQPPSALGRAGRSVLQIDENGYYGGTSTAFYSFADICTWVSRVNDGHEPGFSNAVVFQEEGVDGKRGYTVSLSPHLVYWHSALLRLLRSADMTDSFSWQAVGSWWVWLTDEDVAVPAATSGITLGEVGVKAAKMVAAVTGAKKKKKGGWNKGRKKEPAAEDDAAGTAAAPGEEPEEKPTTLRRVAGSFREVPCTFEDVAWSTDLTDRDRGHLGEFLRFVMKHDSDEPADQKYRDTFQGNRTKTLYDFISKNFPLPPSAITSLSSLTLLPTPPTKILVAAAVPRLATYFGSLGNIPDVRSAAALTIAYGGSAELCQVFSRAAAVAGGVNVLGRGIKSVQKSETAPKTLPETETGEEVKRQLEVELNNGETVYVDWIIGDDSTKSSPSDATSIARAAYIISDPLSPIFEKKYKDEAIVPAATVLMVPATGEDAKPVYIVVRSDVTGECPRGQCLLYASTETPGKAGYDDIESAVRRLLDNQSGV